MLGRAGAVDALIGPVPDTWVESRLSECCDVQPGPSGSVLKRTEHVTGGIPVVKARDIGAVGINPAPRDTVSVETAARLHRYRLVEGDILLVRIGVTTRHALVSAEQDGWLVGGSCLRLRARPGFSRAYLNCYLSLPAVQEWLADHTKRGVLPTISARAIGTLPVALPPADIQQRVTEVASNLDAKIRAHENVVQATRALREQLLPELLSGGPSPIVQR